MNTNSLNNIAYCALAISCIALALCLYALWNLRKLNRLRQSFFSGKNGGDLEEIMHAFKAELAEGGQRQQALEHALRELEHNFTFAIQKVGVVRFNPFEDGGGNFSFCLALLDRENSGVVITSMHGRQQNRIYTKKIFRNTSDHPLTEEEVKAVQQANSQSA